MDLLEQFEQSLAQQKISIVEFAESDDFCGKPLYPRQRVLLKLLFLEELEGWEEDILNHWIAGGRNGSEISITPSIREKTQYLRERNYSHFREAVLVGGRRSSKGFITGIASAKIMWDTLQLQDPGRHFGVDPKKEIYFSCVAASEDQAKQYQFADLINTVEGCAAFKPYWVRGLETEFRVATPADLRAQGAQQTRRGASKSQRDIARLRGKALAANAGTVRGSASMVIVFDEMAHMMETAEGKASASQVYAAAKPSLDQFGKAAMIFCNSSPYSKVGKFFERHEEAMLPFDASKPIGMPDPESGKMKGNGNPYTFSFQFPSWALFERYDKDPNRRFRRAITVSPDWSLDWKDEEGNELLSEEDKEQITLMQAEEAGNPDTFKVERRGKFAEVQDAYLNPEMVDRMYSGLPAGYDEDGSLKLDPFGSNYGDDTHVYYTYHAHLDPSSTTAGFGFAMGHIETFTHKDGSEREHVVFDIIKRWQPQFFEGGAIDWEIVLDEVMRYIEIFRPQRVTFDQFQSDQPIQWLTREISSRSLNGTQIARNFRTNERNWKQAETFKTALYQGLVHAPSPGSDPHHAIDLGWSANELKFLVRKPSGGKFDKVDKQDVGPVQTKDMADCIMEVVESLIGNRIASMTREQLSKEAMSLGAPGGYSIGGAQQGVKNAPELQHYYGTQRFGDQAMPPGARAPRNSGTRQTRVRGISRKSR
jgi:hypothetical protein